MATLRGVVVLPAAGTFTQVVIDTNIATDSTSGWEINGFRAVLKSRDASGVEVLESNDIDCILSTRATTITTPDEPEEIARVCWALGFGTAVGATSIEEQKVAPMLDTRLTVQPNIYVGVFGSATIGSITDIYYEISYTTTKLNNNELLRLLIGGV